MSENNFKEIWIEANSQLKSQYKNEGRENEFNLWFNLEYVSDDKNVITAAVASDFMLQSMTTRGNIDIIKNKIKEISGIDIEIKFIIKNTSVAQNSESSESTAAPNRPGKEKGGVKKADSEKESEKEGQEIYRHPDLDENFTFEAFVPGDNNMYAYKASVEAAKKPGKAYSPILLYGGSGLGKTHLMESIGNYIFAEKKGKVKLSCISAESLLNEFTNSLSTKTAQKFKNKYRNLDVFLLDDIHFLQGKKALQDEVFYIFDSLEQNRGQMVFTCDRPLNELKEFNDRLRTRFSKGLCIDMQPPNYETRKAILLKKLSLSRTKEDKKIPDEFIDYIASHIESNVRDLEGALTKVVGYIDLLGNNPLTFDEMKNLLDDKITSAENSTASIEKIQKVVADYYGISQEDIKSKKQTKKIAFPRHVAIYIAREITEYSFQEIGGEFGGKDHSTIMNSCNKISDLIKIDATLDNAIKNMIKEIKQN